MQLRRLRLFASVCLSVCLSVCYALTFERFERESSLLVCRYIFRGYISSSRSRPQEQKNVKSNPATAFCDRHSAVSLHLQWRQVHFRVWRYLPGSCGQPRKASGVYRLQLGPSGGETSVRVSVCCSRVVWLQLKGNLAARSTYKRGICYRNICPSACLSESVQDIGIYFAPYHI